MTFVDTWQTRPANGSGGTFFSSTASAPAQVGQTAQPIMSQVGGSLLQLGTRWLEKELKLQSTDQLQKSTFDWQAAPRTLSGPVQGAETKPAGFMADTKWIVWGVAAVAGLFVLMKVID